jgi:hypothetical protein
MTHGPNTALPTMHRVRGQAKGSKEGRSQGNLKLVLLLLQIQTKTISSCAEHISRENCQSRL